MAAPNYSFAQPSKFDEPEIIYLDNSSYVPDYNSSAAAQPIATTVSTTATHPYTTNHQSMTPYYSATSSHSSSSCALPPPPDVSGMKRRRQRGKVAAGVVGGAVGLIALGPLGMVVLGTASALAVKHGGRARERKAMRQYERRITQDMAQRSAAAAAGVHA